MSSSKILCVLVLGSALVGCRTGSQSAQPSPGGTAMPAGDDSAGAGAVFTDGAARAEVVVEQAAGRERRYALSTNQPLRDGVPANPRRFAELPGQPVVRSGSDLFDALYALALEEAREDSVESIRDGAFNEGAPLKCPPGGCFETGRLWTYVWTRDTAYAVALGLAAVDPTRARNSLEFKLSERRGGGDLQIVQDTGSGGSYPVSSDRLAWALGAWELLKYLDGPERQAFRDRAFEALSNSIEHDRAVIFDAASGLYRGEQSFLDWREQTYPEWTRADVVPIGVSQALSTNLVHLRALEVAAALARERADPERERRYTEWARPLREAIRARFWRDDVRLFSTFRQVGLEPSPARRFDLLGNAFAVLFDAADESQARAVLASYPHAGEGPPVVWPQQPGIAVYHNRSFWPFVTAFWLKAAVKARNDAVATYASESLVRGAALNLSNMENFELVTGAPRVEEGATSGPVVNSQRQLWSVAGYLSMVHETVFGLEAGQEGLRFAPYVTRELRHGLFARSERLTLDGFPYKGRRLTVEVSLPPKTGRRTGAYQVGTVRLDGRSHGGLFMPGELRDGARIEMELIDQDESSAPMTVVRAGGSPKALFGPPTPSITGLALAGDRLQLQIDPGVEAPETIKLQVYRDGERVGVDLPGETRRWVDPGSEGHARHAWCYSVESEYRESGNASHRSPAVCWIGERGGRLQRVNAKQFSARGGTLVERGGRAFHEGWGAPGHRLELTLRPRASGLHRLQLLASNGGPVNTGVTCAVKRVTVEELPGGRQVAQAQLFMPHTGSWDTWLESSPLEVKLEAAKTYRVRIDEDSRSVNMSAFAHFANYTGGRGGREGPSNQVHIAELRLLALEGEVR